MKIFEMELTCYFVQKLEWLEAENAARNVLSTTLSEMQKEKKNLLSEIDRLKSELVLKTCEEKKEVNSYS